MAFATIDVTKGITGTIAEANLPTIPVAKGGTGLTSGTSGQFLKFTGSTTVASSAVDTGKIVQTKMDGNINFSGDVGTNSTDFQYFGNEISITPTSSSNALIFHLHLSDVYVTGSKNVHLTIYDKTNSTYVTGALDRASTRYSTTDSNEPVSLMYIMETAGSGARTYQGMFRRGGGSGYVYANNGGANGICRFCIMEVVKG